jgi:hypothetical protein
MSGENPRVYPGIGSEFRSKFGKLKLTPADAKANKEEYLIALIKSMIVEDEELPGTNSKMPNYTENFIRVLPSLSEAYTNPVACDLKAEFAKHIAEIAGPKDDPVYIELVGMYVGKFYTISRRALLPHCFAAPRYSSYEVLLVPVTAVGKPPASRYNGTLERDTLAFHTTSKFQAQT